MLRAIILLLICMNLGVAAWWTLHRDDVSRPWPATEDGISSLTLLSESERAALKSSSELSVEELSAEISAASKKAVKNKILCLSIGPFTTPVDLRKAMATLMPKVSRIQFRELATTTVRGYRVFLPAASSRAQALETARALAARGLSDYYVVTAGEQQNTVSLGIFREKNNAEKRRAEARALGYNALLEARTERMPQWWVDVVVVDGFDWYALLPDPKLQSVSATCF